jgi:phage-related protein (TIGR01555 family)
MVGRFRRAVAELFAKAPVERAGPVVLTQSDEPKRAALNISAEAVQRSKVKAHPVNPFEVKAPLHPESVRGSASLAMDDATTGAVAEYSGWAASNFAQSAIGVIFDEGQAFVGYPILAELAQRPEYRRITETIARHMTRNWIELKAKGDEDKSDKISKLNDFMVRLNLKAVVQKALEHDGFFGRGHIFLDFGETARNAAELGKPIGDGAEAKSKAKVSKVKPLLAVRTVEPVWTYPTGYNSINPLDPNWYNPEMWLVMGTQVHASRLLRFVGREVPDLLKPAYSFGGLSLSQMAKPYVDNWLSTRQAVNDIIRAFTVFVLKSNLADTLMVGGEQLFRRAALFNNVRDNSGLMMIDKADEEFENVSAPLGTLDALQAQAQEHMAAVSGIPIVILLGINPAGLNATSAGDIEIFYDWIHSCQEHQIRPNLTKILNFMQLSEFGEVDPDIIFDFNPLLSESEKEKAETRRSDAETDQIYVDMGALDPGEVRKKIADDPDSQYPGLDPNALPEPPPMPAENDPEEAAPQEQRLNAA